MDVLKPTRFGRTLSTSSRQSREERNGEFFRFVDQTSHIGCDGYNNSVKFNSPSTLRKWWEQASENRIARALNSGCSSVTTIRNNYLIIFSILAYINKTQFISEFIKLGWQDLQLPLLEDDRRRFGEDPEMTDMLHNFCDYQWRFCPVVFSKESRMDERVLNPRQILPIEMQVDLGSPITNAKSIIRRVKLYDDCCDPKWCHCTTIVLKEYQTRKNEALRDAWHQEHNAFVSIETFDNIIKYLGSFEQDGRCFIAMEYANGGSLKDLFKKNIRPKTTQEEACFWKALMGLFKAINHIHNLGPRMDGERIAFAHRDINPDNILVFQDDEPFSERFQLKLADFDASTTTQPTDHTGLGSHDNNGSRTYSAPEASRFYAEQEVNLMQLPFNGDVWSLGCVLSMALVWLSGGMAAVEATEQHRKNAIKTYHPHIDGSGYEACFHDGKNVLSSVLESHRNALSTLQPTDIFSRGIRDLIEKHILVPTGPRGSRSNPMDIWDEFNAITRKASLGAWDQTYSNVAGGPSSPGSLSRDPPPIHVTRFVDNGGSVEIYRPPEMGNQSPNGTNATVASTVIKMYPDLTVDEVDRHRRCGRKKEDLLGYSNFRRGIQPRHFIIIIDDSESMRRKQKDVGTTAEALLWILKGIDSEGVEVRFTSDPSKRYPSRSWPLMRQATKQLMKVIWERLTGNDSDRWCNMELALNTILNDQVVQPGRPTSVLILTDGMWGPGSGSRSRKEQGATLNSAVEETFLNVLGQMERKGMKRTEFSIQFVSFGNDPVGLRQLDYLDDEAPYRGGNGRRVDIVDHKGSGDNIWAILWGAVNEYNDAIRTSSIRNGVEGS